VKLKPNNSNYFFGVPGGAAGCAGGACGICCGAGISGAAILPLMSGADLHSLLKILQAYFKNHLPF
jgi:hypothetical protein